MRKSQRTVTSCSFTAALAISLAVGALTAAIVALSTMPTVPSMESDALESSRRRTASEKCPFGGEFIRFYSDVDGNGRYTPDGGDVLVFQQEVCQTAEIAPIVSKIENMVEEVNVTASDSRVEHDAFAE